MFTISSPLCESTSLVFVMVNMKILATAYPVYGKTRLLRRRYGKSARATESMPTMRRNSAGIARGNAGPRGVLSRWTGGGTHTQNGRLCGQSRGNAARAPRAAVACARTGRLSPPVHSWFPLLVGLFALANFPHLFQGEFNSQDGSSLKAWSIGWPRVPEGEWWNLAGTVLPACPYISFCVF